ncbi:MAG: efflux RND transporter periplasmic adaptor subunit [Candidatus Paceibacterota bacterium]
MKKIFGKLKNKKKLIIIGGIILVVLLAVLFLKDNKKNEAIYNVQKSDVEQSVLLSGKIETTDKADLGFATSGRLARIFVKNNQEVRQGQNLAQLEIGDLLAELRIKQINSKTSDIDLTGAKDEVDRVTIQENTKVESAYRNLLTEDLALVPSNNTHTVTPPDVSGIYNGPEGKYDITIDKENVTVYERRLRTFGLESTLKIINDDGPTMLGTRGLFVSFPDDLKSYEDTNWILEIPNKSGASYLSNFNAYNEAKNQHDVAIKNAELKYQKLLSEKEGNNYSSIAQAEIQKIYSEIRKNTISAPFNGRVTNIEKQVGENASTGEQVITVLGENKLQVVLQVSELDVSKLIPESPITISIDAFLGETFLGVLKTINSRDTKVDGVPVYEAFVELPADPRVKTGMNAKGTIVLATKKDVVAIPSYLIEKNGETSSVEVLTASGKIEKRIVEIGLLGTDSMVEIISGLSVGENLVSSPAK